MSVFAKPFLAGWGAACLTLYGAGTAPDVAVTLDSFYYGEHFPELAAVKRRASSANSARPSRPTSGTPVDADSAAPDR